MIKKAVLQSRSLLVLLCFFIITLHFGASQAAETKVFSLDQLIAMALETSPELKMAEQDILAAKGEYKEAKGGQRPQLDFIATGHHQNAEFPVWS